MELYLPHAIFDSLAAGSAKLAQFAGQTFRPNSAVSQASGGSPEADNGGRGAAHFSPPVMDGQSTATEVASALACRRLSAVPLHVAADIDRRRRWRPSASGPTLSLGWRPRPLPRLSAARRPSRPRRRLAAHRPRRACSAKPAADGASD